MLRLDAQQDDSVTLSSIQLAKAWNDPQQIQVEITLPPVDEPAQKRRFFSAATIEEFQSLLQTMAHKEQILKFRLEEGGLPMLQAAQELGILPFSHAACPRGATPNLHLTIRIPRDCSNENDTFLIEVCKILGDDSLSIESLIIYFYQRYAPILRAVGNCSSLKRLKMYFYIRQNNIHDATEPLDTTVTMIQQLGSLLSTDASCELEELVISSLRPFSIPAFLAGFLRNDQTTNTKPTLRRLGLLHLGLTTHDADELLSVICWRFNNLQVLDLFDNDINSRIFSKFARQPRSCSLQELKLYQNPCRFSDTTPWCELRDYWIQILQKHPELFSFGGDFSHLDTASQDDPLALQYLADRNRARAKRSLEIMRDVPIGLWPNVLGRTNRVIPYDAYNDSRRQASVLFSILQNSQGLWIDHTTTTE